MTYYNKTRVFHRAQLEELRQHSNTLLQAAIDISEDMETELATLKNIMSSIPAEAKSQALESALQTTAGTLRNYRFEECKTTMNQTLTKLIEDIPQYDKQIADTTKSITDTTTQLAKRIADLTDLIGKGNQGDSLHLFHEKLNHLKNTWDQESGTLANNLVLIQAKLKGIEAYCSTYSKDPVQMATGNFISQHTDLTIKSQYPLHFTRSYNALQPNTTPLESGWTHNHAIQLILPNGKEPISNLIRLILEDGREEHYVQKEGSGTPCESLHGDPATLRTDETGYTYETPEGISYHFDQTGKIITQRHPNGSALHYTYAGQAAPMESLLTAITTDTGENLHLSYHPDQTLRQITDHTGRSITYTYQANHLSTITDPLGNITTYQYTPEGLLTTLQENTLTPTVQNTYDTKGRITTQTFPDDGTMTYRYQEDQKQVTLTEQNGNQIRYTHDAAYRHTQTTYTDGAETYQYTKRNRKKNYTDKKGNTTHYAYNQKGDLTQILYPDGTVTKLTYDQQGNITTILRKDGTTHQAAYNPGGSLHSQTNAQQETTVYTYDTKERIRSIHYPDTSTQTITYDQKGNITTLTTPQGITYHYTYDALNRVTQVLDGNQNPTQFTYDAKNQLLTVTNAQNNTRTYTYTPSGQPATRTDYDNTTISQTYTPMGQLATQTDQAGNTTRLTYTKTGRLATLTQPNGAITRYTYDLLGNLTTQENPLGGITHYTYDPCGNCTGKTDPLGNTTTYQYNSTNQCTKIYQNGIPLCHITYDAMGRTTQIKQGTTTHHTTYDWEGRPLTKWDETEEQYTEQTQGKELPIEQAKTKELKEKQTQGTALPIEQIQKKKLQTLPDEKQDLPKATGMTNYTTYTYTSLGNLSTITRDNQTTYYNYAPGGQLIRIQTPQGDTITYQYDTNGNRIKESTQSGAQYDYQYDNLNQLVSRTDQAGNTTTYTYDPAGRLTGKTDTRGNTTTYTYTKTGRLSQLTDPLGTTVAYTYDTLNNLITIEKPGQITTYQRNKMGQIETIQDPLGNLETYHYDKAGYLQRKTDQTGATTTYTYTPAGTLETMQYPDGKAILLTYDGMTQLKEIKDWTGTLAAATLTAKTNTAATTEPSTCPQEPEPSMCPREPEAYAPVTTGINDTIQGTTGANDTMQGSTGANDTMQGSTGVNGTIKETYDAYHRLLKRTYGTHLTTAYTYTPQGYVATLTHTDPQGILDTYTYTYDGEGNCTQQTKQRRDLPEDSGTYTYTYDPLNRIQAVYKDQTIQESYTYDPFGNRTKQIKHQGTREETTEYTYNPLGQLLTTKQNITDHTGKPEKLLEKSYHYAYDKRGNQTHCWEQKGTQAPTLQSSYTYDVRDHLISAQEGDYQHTYTYNGLGNRLQQSTQLYQKETEILPKGTEILPKGTEILPKGTEILLKETEIFSKGTKIHPAQTIRYTHTLGKPYQTMETATMEGEQETTCRYLYRENPVGIQTNTGLHYYLTDAQGSPLRKMSQEGNVESSYTYDHFGAMTFIKTEEGIALEEDTAPEKDTIPTPPLALAPTPTLKSHVSTTQNLREQLQHWCENPFGYTGYQREFPLQKTSHTEPVETIAPLETRYYAGARYYQAELGRFLGTDTIKGYQDNLQTQNTYTYAFNNPATYVDQSGNWPSTSATAYSGLPRYLTGDSAPSNNIPYAAAAQDPNSEASQYYQGIKTSPTGCGLSGIEELKYMIYHAGDSKLGETLLKIGYAVDPGAIAIKNILNIYLILGEGKSSEEAKQEGFLLYRGIVEGMGTAAVDIGAGILQAPASILNLLGAIIADGGSGKLGTQLVNDLHSSLIQTVETLKTGSARDKGRIIGTVLLDLVTIVLGGAGASKKLKGVSKLDDLDNVDDLGRLKDLDEVKGSALLDDVGKGGKGASGADDVAKTTPKSNPNNTKVQTGQQDKHIPGTNNYNQEIAKGKYRSTLTENPQQLLDDFAGTGQKIGTLKERIDFGKVIGQYYDEVSGTYTETTKGIIHYNSKGQAHIVPARP